MKKNKSQMISDSYISVQQREEEEEKTIFDKDTIINMLIAVSCAHLIVLIIRYISAIINLNEKIISNNFLYILVASICPIIIWIVSTTTEYWNFHNRKVMLLISVIINAMLTIIEPVYSVIWKIAIPNIFKIPVTAAMTDGMIIFAGQVVMAVSVSGIVALVFGALIYPAFFAPETINKVKRFKITHYVDLRPNKENLYDLKIIKDLETGQDIIIKENDRFVQTLINGASGTGKTSSTYEPGIAHDMDKKKANKEARERELLRMLLEHKAYVEGPINYFDEYRVKPKEKYEKEFEKIWKKYPDCGMTVIAPNNSLIEDVVRLADARGLEVDIIDPADTYEKYEYAREKRINPFYIPLDLPEKERDQRIEDASTVFSNVIIAVNECDGKPEQYFSDIALSITANIATIMMLARNLQGKQTNFSEIQRCIIDINELREPIKYIEDYYNMEVKETIIGTQKGKEGKQADAEAFANNENRKIGIKKNSGKDNPYYETINFIKTELLGQGAEKMFDQGRGIRNLVNKILKDRRIKAILTASDDERIDFEEMFSKNRITVVNTALEFGSQKSTLLGLFFILTQKNAVVKRPKKNRTDHFEWVDEVSQYMHQELEDIFALYRQYRVAATFAIQSLSQMEKSQTTKYLKGVFLGAGTHIVFGRLSPEEMEIYSKMAGEKEVDVTQKTVTETSIFEDDPKRTTAERSTPTKKANIEGSDMRTLDFQEVTVLTIDQGRVLEGKLGKVSFLKKSDFAKKNIKVIDWEVVKKKIEIRSATPEEENLRKSVDSKKISKEKQSTVEEEIIHRNIKEFPAENLDKKYTQHIMNLEMAAEKEAIKKSKQEETVETKNKEKNTNEIEENLIDFSGLFNAMDDDSEEEDDVFAELEKMNMKG